MKKTPKLLLMILILLVLVCLCLLVRSCDDDTSPAQNQVIYDAPDIDGDSVTALTVENENGTFAFKKQGGAWVLSDAPDVKINSDAVASLAQSMIDVTGTNRIDGVLNLTQYGLDEPKIKITVTDRNGDETYRIGNLNGIISAYYFCSEQHPEYVFTVESSVCESFKLSAAKILVLDFPQPPVADSIKSVEFKTGDNVVRYDSVTEFLYNDEEQITDENPNGAVYSHTATRTADGKTADFSYADFYRLAEAVAAVKPSGDYFWTPADNELYFASPMTLTVTYTVREKLEADSAAGGYVESEESYTVYLSAAEDGTLYAKSDADSSLIYRLTESKLSEFAR